MVSYMGTGQGGFQDTTFQVEKRVRSGFSTVTLASK
jgi:hypothetical protein